MEACSLSKTGHPSDEVLLGAHPNPDINALFLTCHSSVPTEGTEEGSGLVLATTQRQQRTSPPLGGHFRIQLPNTVISGKGAIGGATLLTHIISLTFPREQHPGRLSGDSIKAILFIFQCLKVTILKMKDLERGLLLMLPQPLHFVDVQDV